MSCKRRSGSSVLASPPRRLQLTSPWTLFYGLLMAAGVGNFLPTRYAPAAAVLLIALGAEFLALTAWRGWAPESRAIVWSAVPWGFAVAVWCASACAGRGRRAASGLDRAWFWFRDHWGASWGLRVRDRFNETARGLDWPIRLGWNGVHAAPGRPAGDDALLAQAEAAFVSQLRRFAEPERVRAAGAVATACESECVDGS